MLIFSRRIYINTSSRKGCKRKNSVLQNILLWKWLFPRSLIEMRKILRLLNINITAIENESILVFLWAS